MCFTIINKFQTVFVSVAVAQWVRRWSRLRKVKVRYHVGMFTKSLFSNDFYFSFMLGLTDFSDNSNIE